MSVPAEPSSSLFSQFLQGDWLEGEDPAAGGVPGRGEDPEPENWPLELGVCLPAWRWSALPSAPPVEPPGRVGRELNPGVAEAGVGSGLVGAVEAEPHSGRPAVLEGDWSGQKNAGEAGLRQSAWQAGSAFKDQGAAWLADRMNSLAVNRDAGPAPEAFEGRAVLEGGQPPGGILRANSIGLELNAEVQAPELAGQVAPGSTVGRPRAAAVEREVWPWGVAGRDSEPVEMATERPSETPRVQLTGGEIRGLKAWSRTTPAQEAQVSGVDRQGPHGNGGEAGLLIPAGAGRQSPFEVVNAGSAEQGTEDVGRCQPGIKDAAAWFHRPAGIVLQSSAGPQEAVRPPEGGVALASQQKPGLGSAPSISGMAAEAGPESRAAWAEDLNEAGQGSAEQAADRKPVAGLERKKTQAASEMASSVAGLVSAQPANLAAGGSLSSKAAGSDRGWRLERAAGDSPGAGANRAGSGEADSRLPQAAAAWTKASQDLPGGFDWLGRTRSGVEKAEGGAGVWRSQIAFVGRVAARAAPGGGDAEQAASPAMAQQMIGSRAIPGSGARGSALEGPGPGAQTASGASAPSNLPPEGNSAVPASASVDAAEHGLPAQEAAAAEAEAGGGDGRPHKHDRAGELVAELGARVVTAGTHAAQPEARSAESAGRTAPDRGEPWVRHEAAEARTWGSATERPQEAGRAVPLREVRLRIAESGRQAGVEVRMGSGEQDLRVTVRTPQPELNEALRGGLEDLAARLAERGIEAQLWRPVNAGSGPQGAEARAESRMHAGPEGDAGSGWRGHSQQQPDGGHQQQQRDPWRWREAWEEQSV